MAGLLAGAGMGLAKPADVHGYPGPLHVLEAADTLALTDSQRAAADSIRQAMLAETTALGAQLVEVERHFDAAFQRGDIDEAAVDRMTAHAAALRGRIRAAHLKAHLAMEPVLSPQQIATYERLRGRGSP